MAGGSTKEKDKYIVSFNSDTSDSEDDSEGESVKPLPSKSAASTGQQLKDNKKAEVLMNGHAGLANGDIGSKSKPSAGISGAKHSEPSFGKINGPASSSSSLDLDSLSSSSPTKNKTDLGYRSTNRDEPIENGPKLGGISTRSSDRFADSLSSPVTSRGFDYSSSTRDTAKSSSSDTGDLESAYTRAKEKNLLLSKKFDPEIKPKPLIDLSDDVINTSRDAPSHREPITDEKPGYGVSSPSKYSMDLEREMSGYFNKDQQVDEPEHEEPVDFRDFEIKKNIKDDGNEEFDVGADILIYATAGSNNTKPNQFDFDLDRKEPRRQNSYEDAGTSEWAGYRRQTSRPDERDGIMSPKDKYSNLDEKFSAICSKYGRDSRKEGPRGRQDLDDNMELYGTVKVRTSSKQEANGRDPSNYEEDSEDLGFSEERTPRQKLSFDDVVGWKKSPTEDLIQRILADARNEASSTKGAGITRGREPRDEEMFGDTRLSSLEPSSRDTNGDLNPPRRYEYGQAEPSLLERRLAALGGHPKREDNDPYTSRRSKTAEDEEQFGRPKTNYQDDQFYKRKPRGASVPIFDDADTMSLDSASNYRYVPWKERQKAATYEDDDDLSCGASARGYQSNYLCPPGRYEGDSDSDNESYRSTRSPALPDEWFAPQRSEDTTTVVKERTAEARNMVDNQTEVLDRLKKASNSFHDLDAEIRELKQQCFENQAKRQAIIEDIYSDMKERSMIDDEPGPAPRRYVRGAYKSSDSYSSKYSSPYLSSRDHTSRSRESSRCRFDNDFDSDRLGSRALSSVARSKWGEPGGSRAFRSASVCRFDHVEKEHSYDKYGLYNPRINQRAGSCVGDEVSDNKSDYGVDVADDRSDCASVRSHASDKTAEDNEDSSSSYRASRKTTPRYGQHLNVTETPSYTRYSTPTRDSRSTARRATSVTPGDYDGRRTTRGVSLPPPERPFQSRFLSKVREKKAAGVDISTSRDKPFKSRFLTRSFDSDYGSGSSSRGSLASTPDRTTSSRSYRKRDTESGEAAKAAV